MIVGLRWRHCVTKFHWVFLTWPDFAVKTELLALIFRVSRNLNEISILICATLTFILRLFVYFLLLTLSLITGLVPNTTYSFAVFAQNVYGNSSFSVIAEIKTSPGNLLRFFNISLCWGWTVLYTGPLFVFICSMIQKCLLVCTAGYTQKGSSCSKSDTYSIHWSD